MPEMPLVVFSHLRWNSAFERPQQVMSRLAARRPVLFVEEPQPTRRRAALEIIEVGPNLRLGRVALPGGSGGFGGPGEEIVQALLRDHLGRCEWDPFVAWLYTPMAVRLACALGPHTIVYDCMDEPPAFLGVPFQIHARELELLGCADVVMTGGPSLDRAKSQHHRNVHCLPNSVEVGHFALAPHLRDPDDQVSLPHPRLGFFGVVDERVDLDLIDWVARSHPEWQIVIVGPVVRIDPSSLPRRPNLHYLGSRPYDALPEYLAGWDACLMPFALNDGTRFLSPIQSLESMAADRPIVSSPIRDVAESYGDIVYLGEGPEDFVRACERALAAGPKEREARRARAREVLRRTSWDETARTMEKIVRRAARSRPASASSPHLTADIPLSFAFEGAGA